MGQVLAQEENTHFSLSVTVLLQRYPGSAGLLRRHLLFVCSGLTENTRQMQETFVSLGLLKIFDYFIDVFLLVIGVVQDRLRITQVIVSPKHKSVITFTFVLGCM